MPTVHKSTTQKPARLEQSEDRRESSECCFLMIFRNHFWARKSIYVYKYQTVMVSLSKPPDTYCSAFDADTLLN